MYVFSPQLVEDKTFGMKNKNKSKKVQNYIQQVKQSAENAIFRTQKEKETYEEKMAQKAAAHAKKKEEDDWILGGGAGNSAMMRALLKKKKEEEEARKAAEALIDPKTIVCPDFMQGRCAKGDQCKFLHDDTASRKSAKINLYVDPRGDIDRTNATDIVCKYFLDAVEKSHYGWSWECPNGNQCLYRHCLPLGYVFTQKKGKTMEDSQIDEPDIGELIEIERSKLDLSQCTRVTPETFAAWKEKRQAAREAAIEKERQEAAKKGGNKGMNVLSGRALFTFDPTLFMDDEGAAADDDYVFDSDAEQDEDEEKNKEDQFVPDEEEEEVKEVTEQLAATTISAPAPAAAAPAPKKLVKFGEEFKDKKDKKDKKEKKDKKDKKEEKKDKKEKKDDKKDDKAKDAKKSDKKVDVDESLFDSDSEDEGGPKDLSAVLLW